MTALRWWVLSVDSLLGCCPCSSCLVKQPNRVPLPASNALIPSPEPKNLRTYKVSNGDVTDPSRPLLAAVFNDFWGQVRVHVRKPVLRCSVAVGSSCLLFPGQHNPPTPATDRRTSARP